MSRRSLTLVSLCKKEYFSSSFTKTITLKLSKRLSLNFCFEYLNRLRNDSNIIKVFKHIFRKTQFRFDKMFYFYFKRNDVIS